MFDEITIPPLATRSIVGFAEAELLLPEVAEDLAGRIDSDLDGNLASVVGDVAPLVLAAVEAANSLHFRFALTRLDLDRPEVLLGREREMVIGGLDADHPRRKLSVVLPLRGSADIIFPSIAKERRLVTGTAAVFASFLHRETEAGRAFVALAFHALGPSFT